MTRYWLLDTTSKWNDDCLGCRVDLSTMAWTTVSCEKSILAAAREVMQGYLDMHLSSHQVLRRSMIVQ